jgi:cytochrome c-type biogenesis protein CcmH/NrfG
MPEPSRQSQQPVPVKIVLPRWLTRGVIGYVVFCLVLLAASFVYSLYVNKQAEKIFPPEERRRMEEQSKQASENASRKMEELLHPSPTPSPVGKVSR